MTAPISGSKALTPSFGGANAAVPGTGMSVKPRRRTPIEPMTSLLSRMLFPGLISGSPGMPWLARRCVGQSTVARSRLTSWSEATSSVSRWRLRKISSCVSPPRWLGLIELRSAVVGARVEVARTAGLHAVASELHVPEQRLAQRGGHVRIAHEVARVRCDQPAGPSRECGHGVDEIVLADRRLAQARDHAARLAIHQARRIEQAPGVADAGRAVLDETHDRVVAADGGQGIAGGFARVAAIVDEGAVVVDRGLGIVGNARRTGRHRTTVGEIRGARVRRIQHPRLLARDGVVVERMHHQPWQ